MRFVTRLLPVFLLSLHAAAAQDGASKADGGSTYDVVARYHASGSSATTTGTIAMGMDTLTVASAATFAVGQGVLIKGAGEAGVHHVSTITSISGTSITLAARAATAVADAVVQHDDTAAINAALAAATHAGGGVVTLRSGRYRCNGPFSAATNSILTVPQLRADYEHLRFVRLEGESKASWHRNRAGVGQFIAGTVLDFTDAPAASGTYPAALSTAPYVLVTKHPQADAWNAVCLHVERLGFALRSNSCGGIRMSNSLTGTVGDHVWVLAGDATAEPTNAGNFGIWFPQKLSAPSSWMGFSAVAGFYDGVRVSEHFRFRGACLSANINAVRIMNAFHPILGDLTAELNQHILVVDPAAVRATIDLTIEGETGKGNTPAWRNAVSPSGVVDARNVLRGRLAYQIFDYGAGKEIAADRIDVSGASRVLFTNLDDPIGGSRSRK